jgi:hypothetical protein
LLGGHDAVIPHHRMLRPAHRFELARRHQHHAGSAK